MNTVLILGATGYVGSRLAPFLRERGHAVRCLARAPERLRGRGWRRVGIELVGGDVLEPASLAPAMAGIDTVYHLVHSMAAGEDRYEELDRRAARNVAAAAAAAGARRIVYLGGLGRAGAARSPHLRSRQETGEALREGSVPVVEFRAAVIVGAGSLSFEMIRYLVQRVPLMICPRWVYTRTQPIAVADVLAYLAQAAERPLAASRVVEIGGPEVLSYGDMMTGMARAMGLRRLMVRVPVLTPRLSSYWVDLVTPIPAALARALVEGLRTETVVEEPAAARAYDVRPRGYAAAVREALAGYLEPPGPGRRPDLEAPCILRYRVERPAACSPAALFAEIAALGGDRGWPYAHGLWRLRGAIDRLLGGIGYRRGRPHPTRLAVGDPLDFWRVEELEPGRRLRLRAEMKVFGQAWLEFCVAPLPDGSCRLEQTAYYYPRGLFGLIYWWSIYPLHVRVFRGMAAALVRAAAARASANEGGTA